MSTTTADEIRAIWDVDDEDLWGLLGAALLSGGHGMSGDPGDEHFMDFARQWFEWNTNGIRAMVCTDTTSRRLLDDSHGDLLTVAAGVADLLASSFGRPAAATLGVLIARYGLYRFCSIAATETP